MSTSKNGLQNWFNKLFEYCEKWDLSVNVLKTKVMVMSAGNAFVKNIKFINDILECVSTYKYLTLTCLV